MDKKELKQRTKLFSLRIIKLADSMLKLGGCAKILADQILRSGTAVGANYRAACLAKSDKDFINKLKICEEEADETVYWLELLAESNIIEPHLLNSLQEEAKQLTAILTASVKTKKANMNQQQ